MSCACVGGSFYRRVPSCMECQNSIESRQMISFVICCRLIFLAKNLVKLCCSTSAQETVPTFLALFKVVSLRVTSFAGVSLQMRLFKRVSESRQVASTYSD